MRLPLAADPTYLAWESGKTLDPNWYAGRQMKSIEEAPRLEIPEQEQALFKGQLLFRDRCAACHTVGRGGRLGPDLKGVMARRDRDWLIRYLAAPDQMRASKDPIAVELAAKYSGMLMPNLALTKQEMADLISFLEARTTAVDGKEHDHAAHDHAAHDHAGPSR